MNFINPLTLVKMEMQSERDVLQEQLSEQLVVISSLQLRLDEQRLRVESAQKQSNASFEHKIYELKNEIQELKDTIHNRDMRIQDLNNVIEETNKRICQQQKQLNSASEIEKQIVDQFQTEMSRLQSENDVLTSKLQERFSSSTNNSNEPVDKNADIDRLKAKIDEIEVELQFYGSLNLSKDQLIQLSKFILTSTKNKIDITSIIEGLEPDQLRRQEVSFESINSGNGEHLDYKRNPNETVFIGSTFRDSRCADKVHSPFVVSELSTIEKVGPNCVNFSIEEVPMPKGSGDTKHVHFDDELEISRIQYKLNTLEKEMKIKDETIQEYQNNLSEIKKKLEFSCDSIREKTETLSDEINALKEEKQNLHVDLAEVKVQLHDKINKLSEIEKENERKDKMYMNLAKEKRNLEAHITELNARIDEFKNVEDLIAEKNKEIYNLEQQLAAWTPADSTESLKESILIKESELNMLKEHIFLLENKLEEKLKEEDKYYTDYEEVKNELKEKTELLEKFDQENKNLVSLSTERLNLDVEKEKQLKETLSKHEQKIKELETVLQDCKQQLEINKQKSETLLEEYKQKLESNKQNLDDATLVSSELNLEIAKLKKEVAEKDLGLTQNNSFIEKLNKELHHLQELLSEKDKIINQMTVDSNSLHVALEAIQTKIQESGNVVDLKKRLREEQNLVGALYEELKYLKQSIDRYESVESTSVVETLMLLKESVEREQHTNEELKTTKDSLLFELEQVKEKLKIAEEDSKRLKALLDEEKMNSNMVQIQDANIIESMRLRLEALIDEKSEEEDLKKYKQMLDEERISAKMMHIRDANSIESLKVRIDDLLKKEHDTEKLLKIERRIREELETQLATAPRSPFKIDFVQQHAFENDADAGHLFGKYLKSESYRKALIFQKRYLLGLLASYQKCSNINFVLPKIQSNRRPINRFRAAVYTIISIQRMQYIVRRWHTGKRIGSSIMTKRSGPALLTGSPKPMLLPEAKPWSGNSPPCKDRTGRRRDLPLGNAIQESISLAPLQAPALLSQYIERFDSIQQRLGLAVDRTGT